VARRERPVTYTRADSKRKILVAVPWVRGLLACVVQCCSQRSGVTPFKGCVCLRFRLVSRRLGKLAPVGVTFAFQLGEKALVTLLAL
jgi:hypothetical protein